MSKNEETKFFDMKETVEIANEDLNEAANTDLDEYATEEFVFDSSDFDEEEYYDDEDFEDEEYDEQLAAKKSKRIKLIVFASIIGAALLGSILIFVLASKTEYIDTVNVYVDGTKVQTYNKVEKGTVDKLLEDSGYKSKDFKADEAKKSTDQNIYLLEKKDIEVSYAKNEWDRSKQEVYQYRLDLVLNELKIELNEDTEIFLNNTKIDRNKLDDEVITKSSFLKIIDNATKKVVEEIVVPYSIVEKKDPTLALGETQIEVKGVEGLKKITYEVKYVDGKEVSRETVKEELIREVVNEVKVIGTKKPEEKPANNNTGGSSSSGTN